MRSDDEDDVVVFPDEVWTSLREQLGLPLPGWHA